MRRSPVPQRASPPSRSRGGCSNRAPRDVEDLLPQLEARALDLADEAERRLRERGERERRDLRETLERQRDRVREELGRHSEQFKQLTLDFDVEERRQVEANMRSWERRLEQFDSELETRARPRRRLLRRARAAGRAGRPRLPLAGHRTDGALDPNVLAHLEWLGFVQPTGLVVSAPALVRAGAMLDRSDVEGQRRLRECVERRQPPVITDFEAFARSVLGWSFSPKGYAGHRGRADPAGARGRAARARRDAAARLRGARARPARRTRRRGSSSCARVPDGRGFDEREPGGLEATVHGRMERLLRETGVPAGLLFNGRALRLISAPRGESSGYLDFHVEQMIADRRPPDRERAAAAAQRAPPARAPARAAARCAARGQPPLPERGQREALRAGPARALRAAARVPGCARRLRRRAAARAARRRPRRGLPRAPHGHPAACLPPLRRGTGDAAG